MGHFIKQKKGHFVVINSVCGLISPAEKTSYSGCMHALTGFFDSLRGELKD